jgi:AcrR family transcriptional regulator
MVPKPDKKEAILQAMLDLIVERGFHDAPMSVLAKRSGASAGVIYHYFPSKEHLIEAIYLRVKSIKRDALLAGCLTGKSPHDTLVCVWKNAYRFYRTHLRETRFLDQYENSPYGCRPPGTLEVEAMDASDPEIALLKLFQSRKAGGVLNDLPPSVVQELTLGLAMRLAKQPKPLSGAALDRIAETIWRAVTD